MNIEVIDLGRVSFKEAFSRQIQVHNQILQGDSSHTLILCEHPHTITLGRHAKSSNILNYSFIKENSIDLVAGVNRGGDVTYHGPGQLMGYLIFDLRELGRDLGWFLNRIQDLIIRTVASFGLETNVKKGFRGVWIGEQKIASIGIGVDKWISLHGFGLNVNTDLRFFNIIKPCGLDVEMISFKKLLGRSIDMSLVKEEIAGQVDKIFFREETRESLFVTI